MEISNWVASIKICIKVLQLKDRYIKIEQKYYFHLSNVFLNILVKYFIIWNILYYFFFYVIIQEF